MSTEPTFQQFSLFENESNVSIDADTGEKTAPGKYSNFVVYVDESGDHGMQTLDANYPVFVLAFCVFYKRHYSEKVVPALHKFKFNHFGHDLVVLHEHEIRKEKGAFRFFTNRQHKQNFLTDLTSIIEVSNFILISCVIDKAKLRERGDTDKNPYHLALGFCLETLYEFLQEKNQDGALTHVVVECRGKRRTTSWNWSFAGFVTAPTGWVLRCRSMSSLPTRRSIRQAYNWLTWSPDPWE